MKRHVLKQYSLPPVVEFSKNCVVSNQHSRSTFDQNGVCSACYYSERRRKQINWPEREQEPIELCNRFGKGSGEYGVIVPCSGGKDGSFVANQLKYGCRFHPEKSSEAGLAVLRSFCGA